MKLLITILSIGLFFPTTNLIGQRTDSTLATGGITGDTLYIITEKIPKSKFLGNSWFVAGSYTLSKSHELTVNIGRTFGKSFQSGGGFNFYMQSWGIGYSYYLKKQHQGQTVSGFAEVSNYFLPPVTARMEYLFDLTETAHYLRPSLGLNLFHVDVLYSYSFKLVGDENRFKHGLVLRYKTFLSSDNWQKSYPRRQVR